MSDLSGHTVIAHGLKKKREQKKAKHNIVSLAVGNSVCVDLLWDSFLLAELDVGLTLTHCEGSPAVA